MLTRRLQINIAIRTAICLLILSAADILFFREKWVILLGLTIGTVISVLKFGSYAWALESTTKASYSDLKRTLIGIAVLLINLAVLFSALFLSYLHNTWTFVGMATGIMSVPLVLVINTLTEVTGITKNQFFQ